MTAIRRTHIIAAQARKRILDKLGRPVDEKTEKLASLDVDDPRFSAPPLHAVLQVRINNALGYHLEGLWATGPGCVTCRVRVPNDFGGYRTIPAPWPCDTYKALTGDES